MKTLRLTAAFLLLFITATARTDAYTHHKLPVNFLEHDTKAFELAKKENKPIFILISAVWCFWCKVFDEKALVSENVYSYLNKNYINVFVDADINRELYFKYQATALPYIVFLKPDGSLLHKYGGTLYADDFRGLLESLHKKAYEIKAAGDMDDAYTPPPGLDPKNVETIRSTFTEAFLENFDEEEGGVGNHRKFILPQTFLYLTDRAGKNQKRFNRMVAQTMKKAVEKIYDPIEGGFFRYAEKRDWRIPHYEKMLEVNAAMLLLLLKSDAAQPSRELKQAAKKTAGYLSTQLFDDSVGAFMAFQVADEEYYHLSAEKRKKALKPAIIKKVFVDKLAEALYYLLDVSPLLKDPAFDAKIKKGIDFLEKMLKEEDRTRRYYSIDDGKWLLSGTLADHAYLGLLFSKAHKVWGDARYLALSSKVLDYAKKKFWNINSKIYEVGSSIGPKNLEYLMELNSVIATARIHNAEHKGGGEPDKNIEPMLAYFSGLGEILSERAWESKDFVFLEVYARYLTAVEMYLSRNRK